MQTLRQDLRRGPRGLFKQPGFSFIALITFSLGVGATAAIFNINLVGAGAASLPTALATRNSPQESDRARKRDEWQRPGEVMDALGAKPGHRVADIGCGRGYIQSREYKGKDLG